MSPQIFTYYAYYDSQQLSCLSYTYGCGKIYYFDIILLLLYFLFLKTVIDEGKFSKDLIQ